MDEAAVETPPRVSVISAWYNRPEDLEASIHSVLNQEGVEFEYIIIDDASTDQDVRTRLQAIDHPRLRLLLRETNVGFTRAMKDAASLAQGEFIAVHDAGDISYPGRLAAQVEFLTKNPDYVAVGTRVENHTLTTGERISLPLVGDRSKGIDGLIFTHGEVMFRRSTYEAVGGYRTLFYYSQDNDLWRRLKAHGKLGHVDELLYERRIFSNGVMGNARKEVAQALFSNLGAACELARASGRPDPVESRYALALLEQPRTERFRIRGTKAVKRLLQERRFADARDALALVPAGLMTWKMLALYTLLRCLSSRSHAEISLGSRSQDG